MCAPASVHCVLQSATNMTQPRENIAEEKYETCRKWISTCRLALLGIRYSQQFCSKQSIYLCLSADFRRCKRLGNRLTPGEAYLQIAYGETLMYYISQHTVWVSLIRLPIIINNAPLRAAKIYRWHRRMRSSSASHKRLPTCVL